MRLALFFIALAIVGCAPIWCVGYFINQDGSGHVHGAWMIIELLRGNPRFTDIFQFNFIFFPDVSGHWLMALMLPFISAFTVTKIMMTVTYVGFVGAIVWLRWKTVGRDGLLAALLVGGAIGFNWLWLEGFYNFILGLTLTIFATGSYFRWREELNFKRAALLAVLLFLIFISHIASFVIAAGTIAVLCLLPFSDLSKRRLLWSFAAFIPVAPCALIYKLSTEATGTFSPTWRSLDGHYSLSNFLTQLRGVDSFIIISRRSFPFLNSDSSFFAIFTPFIWIVVAFGLLVAATWITKLREQQVLTSKYLPFIALAAGTIFVSLVSPDSLEASTLTGGLLRERIFLVGLIYLIPLYQIEGTRQLFTILAKAMLVFVILFQTAALWDYAVRTDRDAREFLSGGEHVPEGTSLASVTIMPERNRFSANPISSMDNYLGIKRDILIWDNYEFGHRLFPVELKSRSDQEFVWTYVGNNASEINNPEMYSIERAKKLNDILAQNNQRIDTLLVWGNDPVIEAAYQPWFEKEPFFVNGRVRLYRHK